jgi:hypothetical protein
MRPLQGSCAAAAIMVQAAVRDGLKRGFGGLGLRLGRCHRVMALHRWLRRVAGYRLAQAMHGSRLRRTGHRQRPEGRGEHDQQQKSCNPARRSTHLRTG